MCIDILILLEAILLNAMLYRTLLCQNSTGCRTWACINSRLSPCSFKLYRTCHKLANVLGLWAEHFSTGVEVCKTVQYRSVFSKSNLNKYDFVGFKQTRHQRMHVPAWCLIRKNESTEMATKGPKLGQHVQQFNHFWRLHLPMCTPCLKWIER